MAVEFAKLIASIQVDEEMIAEKYPPAAAASRLESPLVNTFIPTEGQKSDISLTQPEIATTEKDSILQQLEPFRKRSGLVPTFDSTKLVKQFLLSSIGASVESILGKSQQGLTALLPEEKALVSSVIDICTFDMGEVEKKDTLKSLSKITRKKDWTPQLFIKSCIAPEQHLDELETRRFKNVTNGNKDVISVIMGLKI